VPARPSTKDHSGSEVWSRPTIRRAISREGRKLGARLRELRRERGLTQEQAAELSGLHAKHLGVIETGGQRNVGLASLVALSVAYGVPVGALFEAMPKPSTGSNPRKKRIAR
jgi:transcriptional regulator with XRE-family HTH domain